MNVRTAQLFSADEFAGFDENPSSLHKYLYAINDPVNHIDPSGNFALPVTGMVVVAVITVSLTAIVASGNDTASVGGGGDMWDIIATTVAATGALTLGLYGLESFVDTNPSPDPNKPDDAHHTIPEYLCGHHTQAMSTLTHEDHNMVHTGLALIRIGKQQAETQADTMFGRRRTNGVRDLARTSKGRALIGNAIGAFYRQGGWSRVGKPPIGEVFPIEKSKIYWWSLCAGVPSMKTVRCDARYFSSIGKSKLSELTLARLDCESAGLSLFALIPPYQYALCAFDRDILGLESTSSNLMFERYAKTEQVQLLEDEFGSLLIGACQGMAGPFAYNSFGRRVLGGSLVAGCSDAVSFLVRLQDVQTVELLLQNAERQFSECALVRKFGGDQSRVNWSGAGLERLFTHPQPGIVDTEDERQELLLSLIEIGGSLLAAGSVDVSRFSSHLFYSRPAVQFTFPVRGHEFTRADRVLFDLRLKLLSALQWPQFVPALRDEGDFDEFEEAGFEWKYFRSKLAELRSIRSAIVDRYPVIKWREKSGS